MTISHYWLLAIAAVMFTACSPESGDDATGETGAPSATGEPADAGPEGARQRMT